MKEQSVERHATFMRRCHKRGMQAYQLEVLAGDMLLGQETIDEVGCQE
jgi:hypothetical protein